MAVSGGEMKDIEFIGKSFLVRSFFGRGGFMVTTPFLDLFNETYDFLSNFDPCKRHNATGSYVTI